jgi:hypothetical protein
MYAREASIRQRSGRLVCAYVAFTMLTVRAGTDIPRPLLRCPNATITLSSLAGPEFAQIYATTARRGVAHNRPTDTLTACL